MSSTALRTDIRFDQLGLRPEVLQGITQYGFEHPTDIQAELIPAVLAGHDAIGQARTGSGKSAAFGLPVMNLCEPGIKGQCLVLAPTRELAVQLTVELQALAKFTGLNVVSIIGGEAIGSQQKLYQKGGEILVGTPGRVMDLEDRGIIDFSRIRFVVLDEVDRMLDIGFREDIRKILRLCPQGKQTIFVSATISPEIESLARSHLHEDVVKIRTVTGSLTVSQVDQSYLPVEPWDKRSLLLHLLRHEEPAATIVFCRTKMTVQKVADYLKDKGISAHSIHGDLTQGARTKVMQQLRDEKLDVLVASDLAARGLDVDHISHVINYDLPEDPDNYIHRIGRTARAGRHGTAWSFVCPDQGQLLTEIEKLAGVEIPKKEYPDFKPGPPPADIRERRERDALNKDKITTHADRQIAVAKVTADTHSAEELARMFPGGVIPSGPPMKRGLGGKFRTRGR